MGYSKLSDVDFAKYFKEKLSDDHFAKYFKEKLSDDHFAEFFNKNEDTNNDYKTVKLYDVLIETSRKNVNVQYISFDDKNIDIFYKTSKCNKIILITTPIPAKYLQDVLDYFHREKSASDILLGTVGQGFTEQHIVTTHSSGDTNGVHEINVYDSKWSDCDKFFSNVPPNKLNYHPLGTQSIFDGVTCGYHTLFNLLACIRLFDADKKISTQNILEEVQNSTQSPVIDVNNILQKSTHFSTFMKRALKQTYYSDIFEEEAFSRYFLGFPKTGSSTYEKCIFVIGFEWLLVPFINILKLPSVFLMNILAESINYIKNKVFEFAPTDGISQSLRTLGLLVIYLVMYVFKTLALLFSLILSPQETAKKAYDIHPILGALSAIASLSSYAALSIFAGPLLAAFAPPLLIKILASPLLSIWSNLNAGVSASLLLTVAFGLGSGLKWILDKLFNVSETNSTSVSPSTLGDDGDDGDDGDFEVIGAVPP